MSDNVMIEAKNIKKYYVPRTAVIYFTESELTVSDNLSKLLVEHTRFFQIGSHDFDYDDYVDKPLDKNRFKKEFFNWIDPIKKNIYKPSVFFNQAAGRKIIDELKNYDLVVVVLKSSKQNSIDYVSYLIDVLKKYDVFAFHYMIDSFILPINGKKQVDKLIQKISKNHQIHVSIKEESVVEAYKQATISNRNYYINLYTNDLIESFLSPFLDPVKNPDLFPRVKGIFYQNQRNFESKVITSIGYSDVKKDHLDLALIQALANPIFYGAFRAANTFIVNVKTPYWTPGMLERINFILNNVIGDGKNFIVSSYVGAYSYDVYCQVSIMAINVDEHRLIRDTSKISDYVKHILNQVSKSNDLFREQVTEELLLEGQIEILDDPYDK